MKISYNWLKEYINCDLAPEAMSEILTDTGLEVEGVDEIETIKGGLKGVVIGEVKSCEPHPNADKLKKTTVDVGSENLLEIVCGAPNVAAGQKVAVATVGTTIYTDEGDFKIKKSKIRGEVSEGMICAEDELNLGQSHDGIMVLKADAKVGMPASEYFNIESDFVLEIGLTPNRTDALGHYGVARDLRAALIRHGHTGLELTLPSITSFSVHSMDHPIDIEVKDTEACPRYTGVSLKNVKVEASPDWLQNRLRAIGIGPINNVVDITNYVLHETGHPLHAFDADKIAGQKIIVKTLESGTKFTTLDGKERTLDENDLMICDNEKPICIAGVLGGLDSGVSANTTNVFLESAYFDSVSVRKTAKRHALNTDASFRYERGVDPEMTMYALQRAALMIRDMCGGELAMNIKEVYPKEVKGATVELDIDRMNRLIGQEIPLEMVRKILSALDIKVKSEAGTSVLLEVPAYRADVTREVDIVEEVLRIYGFNAIDIPQKMHISVAQTDPKGESRYRELISDALSARGYNEIMNNSLTKPAYFTENGFDESASIKMLNALSQDLAVMRQSLLFGGLESIQRNANRQRPNLSLYEFGSTYKKTEKGYEQKLELGLWKTGLQTNPSWNHEAQKSDFYSLKSEVEQVLMRLGFDDWDEIESTIQYAEYGLDMVINKRVVASILKVNKHAAALTEVKQEVFFAQLDWEYLCKKAAKLKITFKDLPKYPEVRRDLALLLDKSVLYIELKKAAMNSERKLLKDIHLFDMYEGKNLPDGKKSYALSFVLRDEEKTLNDKQVDKVMSKIIDTFKKQFSAELR